MNLLAIILTIILIIIFYIIMILKLFSYKKQIRNITTQIKEFKERKTNKIISTEIYDKDIDELCSEINEYLLLYKKNEQEKIIFENTLKQGTANISHDLRTPLTSIIGYLRLLKNNEIDKEEALEILTTKSNKLKILIDDFFELASIESDDYELDIKKLNLTNIVRDETLSLYEAFNAKEINPIINILDKPLFIMGDIESLERIIGNLLSNALKYAEKEVSITLKTSNNKAILEISNICKNIVEEDVLHMFDRFYMADKVRKGEGVGLGLSIVKSLIDKLDGTITSELKENKLSIICEWNCIKF
ncbi:Signal transduction histidine kinase [Clostridium cavendishii DSM 21758]|uniref:histidine kinase n=1 Tax=Clostridium cavendishii DSM 21758 TaxID=1121302 RepID=A0A1M6H1H0_9CLOT|nr:HAMP domain-containing sensor histidine kinase [Clostridium cavendishii]SHJ15996.1 Signal transduction histidine kinase [Clostridium cavendishii DSM 21758]